MKLLTIVIPCYNSQKYMSKAIECAASGGEETDVLVVDDGSTDDTGAIADAYAKKYPGIVRVIHQENSGHGEGVNQGIRLGLGMYLKVLDSDDRVNPALLKEFLNLLRQHATPETQIDLAVHDYVYDTADKENFFRISYRYMMKPGEVLTWDQIKSPQPFTQFMIHCMVYRTALLRDEMKLVLPKNVFYEDNLYIYRPLPFVKTLLYFNQPLHGYFIGRSDQSINMNVIVKRLPQVSSIAEQMITSYTMEELNRLPQHLRKYMLGNLAGQLSTCCSIQLMSGEEGKRQYQALRNTIQKFDPALWRALRHSFMGRLSTPDTVFGQHFLLFCYHTSRHIMKFE